MENPFSAVAIAATAEVIVDTKEQVSYQTTKMQREIILTKLKEKGCRITKQRLRLIDIILQNECSSCKEIFYRALEEDDKLGVATVYRMVNLLEEIGAISRKNMYKVAYSENCMMENACTIELDDGSVHHLSAKKWNSVIRAGLKSCGYLADQKVTNVTINDRYMNENGKFELNQSGLVAYSHGEYYGLGERVGTFGYSVRKKKDTCGRKRRKNYSGKNSK